MSWCVLQCCVCRGMCSLGLEGLGARRFEHAFAVFMWSVNTRLEPEDLHHVGDALALLQSGKQTRKSMEKECGMENS